MEPGKKQELSGDYPKEDEIVEEQTQEVGSGTPIFYHRPHGEPVHGITEEVIQGFIKLFERVIENPERLRFSKPDNLTLIPTITTRGLS